MQPRVNESPTCTNTKERSEHMAFSLPSSSTCRPPFFLSRVLSSCVIPRLFAESIVSCSSPVTGTRRLRRSSVYDRLRAIKWPRKRYYLARRILQFDGMTFNDSDSYCFAGLVAFFAPRGQILPIMGRIDSLPAWIVLTSARLSGW